MKKLLICGLLLALLAGCEKKQESAPSPAGKTEPKVAAAQPEKEKKQYSGPAIVINGQEISEETVEGEYQALLNYTSSRATPEQVESYKPQLRMMAVDTVVKRTLLEQAAQAEGIQADPAQVDQRVNELKSQEQNPGDFERVLKERGISLQELKDSIASDMRIEQLLEKKKNELITINDESLKNYYTENQEQFKTPEQVHAKHILFKVNPDDVEEVKAEKRNALEKIRAQILDGASFGELASKHSDCPSKQRGGDLGSFTRGRMVKEFEDAAFNLEPGKVSEIVQTQFGYHIIKAVEHTPEKVAPFEEVKDQIRGELENQEFQKMITDYINELMAKAKIVYREDMKPPVTAQTPQETEAPAEQAAPPESETNAQPAQTEQPKPEAAPAPEQPKTEAPPAEQGQ